MPTTLWTLREQNYRTSYAKHVKTFFWIDEKYYKENRREILQWAELQGCKVPSIDHGWIEMPDDQAAMMFRLMWAGKCYG